MNTFAFGMVIIAAIMIFFGANLWLFYAHKKKKTRMPKLLFDGTVSVMQPEGMVFVYSLHQDDKKAIPYAWVMVSGYQDTPSEAIMWMIYTREAYRGQGHAKKLIAYLKTKFDVIMTHVDIGCINNAGTKLLMSQGFKFKKSLFKNDPDYLVWTREG